MPDNQVEYTPRNTWAYIEVNTCPQCHRPRQLWANSWVANFHSCADCLGSKFYDLLRTVNRMQGVDEEWDAKIKVFHEEYLSIRDYRNAVDTPAPSPDNCASCYHPFVDGERTPTSWAWEKVDGMDREGVELHLHRECSTQCPDCNTVYAQWSSASHGKLEIMDMVKYLGSNRCTNCVDALNQEYGERAFFYCDECCSYELRDDSRDFNDNTICSSCYNDNVASCDDCDELYWVHNDHDCDENDSNLIHDYSYRPRPHFFGEAKYYFGFELEVESNGRSRREGAKYVTSNLGAHAYLKRDGSLDEGFEIVTHPHTLDEYQSNFNWEVLKGLSQRGYRSWNTNTCGLHVHVSRTAFGTVARQADVVKAQGHELRFIKLIYDNQRQIERLAGRSSSYARFNDKGNLANRVKHGSQDDRYEAVNSQNSETLEVRVFRGSLKRERVLSAVELVHASVEYTRDLKVTGNNNALKWINFVRFVADNTEAYPNLVNAIQSTFDNDTPVNEIN